MAETFAVGDTVRLKSGGPIMTVTRIEPNAGHPGGQKYTAVVCTWFGDKKYETQHFDANVLVKED